MTIATARYKNLNITPRKVRLVADLVRGMEVRHALTTLKLLPQRSTQPLSKLIKSGITNWEKNNKQNDKNNLYIQEIRVDAGRKLKRIQPASQGRALPILKRSSHINITIAARAKQTKPQAKGENNTEKTEKDLTPKPKKK